MDGGVDKIRIADTPSAQHVEKGMEMEARKRDGQDKANEALDQVDDRIVLTPENNARVLRLIDTRVLPIIVGVYFFQILDKVALSYGSVFGLIDGAHLVGSQYSWLSAIVYITQLVLQPLVAFMLVKVRMTHFLSVSAFGWGAALACMAIRMGFNGLIVCRMFLGLFEAGVAPCFIAITQTWWRRREQPMRLSAWYAMFGLTNMFGSLIAWGLGHIESPVLRPYELIFLFFGTITMAYSIVVFFFMDDSPVTARFLKGEDKLVAIGRLRANQQGIESNVWKNAHVKEAMLDVKTWLWGFMMFAISIPSGGIGNFGPLIVQSFGYNGFESVLFNIPFGAVQLVATFGGGYLATRFNMKSPVLAFLSIPPIIGCVMLLVLPRGQNHKAALLGAYYLISVFPGITPLIYSWSAANTAGETKKKVTSGFLFAFQCAGNTVGPNLYTTPEAPKYARGLTSNLVLFIVLIILYGIQCVVLAYLNRRNAKRRVALGLPENLEDLSMQRVKEDGAKLDTNIDYHAFEDRTDLENESFIFVF